jgi:hypothetical protein
MTFKIEKLYYRDLNSDHEHSLIPNNWNASMTSLVPTVDALKQAASKGKQTTAIKEALDQLDSAPKIIVGHPVDVHASDLLTLFY